MYRVNNAATGRADRNERLDRSRIYNWTMLAADGVGLYGAAGGLKTATATIKGLRAAGILGGDLTARAVPAAVRGELTLMLGVQGMKLGSRMINRLVRQQLLEGAAGVLGLISSADGGIVRELIVWVIGEA